VTNLVKWRSVGFLSKMSAMALIACGWSTVVSADVLVLRSEGAGAAGRYKVGTMLADDAAILLGEREKLLLLDDQGVRELAGPRTLKLSDPAVARKPLALADFGTGRRAVVGGTRGFSGGANFVEMGVAEPQCMIEGWPIFASKTAGDAGRSYRLTGPAGGEGMIAFLPGQNRAAWPAAITLTRGENRLTSRAEGSGEAATIVLHLLPAKSAGNIELARLMLEHGCTRGLMQRAGAAE
jgi:hypothetical protein